MDETMRLIEAIHAELDHLQKALFGDEEVPSPQAETSGDDSGGRQS